MPAPEVVIVGAARTPIGRYGGALRSVHPAELGAAAARAALERAGDRRRPRRRGPDRARPPGRLRSESRRVRSEARAGLPDTVPAQTINKACASGMQTIATGAQSIMLGEADVVLAGGIESMSRMPYLIDAEDARWGHKMGNFTLVDAMYRDGFTCSVCGMIMGETVECSRAQYGITREASDAYALEIAAARRARDRRRPLSRRDRAGHGVPTRRASRRRSSRGRASAGRDDDRDAAGSCRSSSDVEGHPGIITAGHLVGHHRRRRRAS